MEKLLSSLMSGWRVHRQREPLPLPPTFSLEVQDTINPSYDPSADVREMISSLAYPAETFDVAARTNTGSGDTTLSFDSPRPSGDAVVDRVHLDWHVARDRFGRIVRAPAMLVLDILHGHNAVATFIARTFARQGIHGFVMHMPHNAARRTHADGAFDWRNFVPSLTQAAADARRSRDVIASFPAVNSVGIQGTSLGGFVATIAASIDQAFDPVLIALAGGDVNHVLSNGMMDAARVRKHLRQAGYDDQKLRRELWDVEPLRLAHRLDPRRTWLLSARWDQVVPAASSRALAMKIGLTESHQPKFLGCHYSCALGAKFILDEMIRDVRLGAIQKIAG